MKKTPEKNEFTDLSIEDRTAKLQTLMGTLSEDEIKGSPELQKILKIEAEKPKKPEKPKETTKVEASKSETPELDTIVQTMINTECKSIEETFADAKFLIETVDGLEGFTNIQKLKVLNTVVSESAKALKTQETTLKTEAAKGNPDSTSDDPDHISSEASGKVTGDQLVEKVFSEMSSAGITVPKEFVKQEKTD